MATRRAPSSADSPPRQDIATPRRADAERSIAAIVEAGLELFSATGNVTMTQVARAAGVGRVTLYAHFPTRRDLVDAVVARAIGQASAAFEVADLESEPADEAVARLLRNSWHLLERFRGLRSTAQAELGERRLRELHDSAFQHVEHLISRGRQDGLFRIDLPLGWLVTAFYAVLHAGADEVDAGRLSLEEVPDVVTVTVLSLLEPSDQHRDER